MAKTVIKINKKGEDGYKVISVRIKEGTLQKIDDLSQKSNRSRNELINIILENSVDDVEINWKIIYLIIWLHKMACVVFFCPPTFLIYKPIPKKHTV